ncbi:TATA box-binding protein-associated factor RNA polymerase I subunit A, variant 3 [Chamberlinius hualienensis]
MTDYSRNLSSKRIRFVLRELLKCYSNDDNEASRGSNLRLQSSTSHRREVGGIGMKANVMSSMTRIMSLAVNCIKSHRWEAAAKMFPSIARYFSYWPTLVWKIGASCLTFHQDSNKTHVSNFANAMIQVNYLSSPEILLDHVIYLMCNGEYEEALCFIENFSKHCQKSSSDTFLAILEGTKGLLEYILWHKAVKAEENLHESSLGSLSVLTETATVIKHAESAIRYLKTSLTCQGNFDVYVQKLVEILEYYERLQEADEVLVAYIQLNFSQPSPYVFLYNFISKNYPSDVPRQIYVLKELAKCCPSHEGVLKLCKLLTNEEIETKTQMLFDLVDYNEWKDQIEVWKLLVETLFCIQLTDKSNLGCVLRYKADRSLWWTNYHFCKQQVNIDDQNIRHLLVYKALMATVVYDSEHNFVVSVSDKLVEVGEEDKLALFNDSLDKAKQLSEALKIFSRQQISYCRKSSAINVGLNCNSPLGTTSNSVKLPVPHEQSLETAVNDVQGPLLSNLLTQPADNYEQFKFTQKLVNLQAALSGTTDNQVGQVVQFGQILPVPKPINMSVLQRNLERLHKHYQTTAITGTASNQVPINSKNLGFVQIPENIQASWQMDKSVPQKVYGGGPITAINVQKVSKNNQNKRKSGPWCKQKTQIPRKMNTSDRNSDVEKYSLKQKSCSSPKKSAVILNLESKSKPVLSPGVIVIPSYKPFLKVKSSSKKRSDIQVIHSTGKKLKLASMEDLPVSVDRNLSDFEVVDKSQVKKKNNLKDCVVVLEKLPVKTLARYSVIDEPL